MSSIRDTGPPDVDSWPPRACEGRDPSMWFPEQGAQQAAAWAKRVCRGCEARQRCEDYAMPIFDLSGIWAGMSAKERTERRNKHKKEA